MKKHLSIIIFLLTISIFQSLSLKAAQQPHLEPWQINYILEKSIFDALSKPEEEKKYHQALAKTAKEYKAKLTSLRSNSIHDLRNITNQILTLITRHCRCFKTIQLSHCNKITTATLSDLITKQKNLQELDLSAMPCLTSDLIDTILQSSTSLTSLALVGSNAITDKHFAYISSKLPQLKTLVLSESSGWSAQALRNLRKARPDLSIYLNFFESLSSFCLIS